MSPAASNQYVEVANKGMITLCVMLATIMEVIDLTIANVALPHIQGALNASQDQITWIVTSYVVSSGIAMPVAGFLAGRYGAKNLLLYCVLGFTIASLLCAVSASLTEMVIFRLMQGVFGAALVPISQSVLLNINPPHKHGQAMATWGIGIMVAPILGPMLGGYITDHFDWRWIFFINLPVGIVAFIGILTFLTSDKKQLHNHQFDIRGFVIFTILISSLQLMLDRGQQKNWFDSSEIKFYVISATLSLGLFLFYSFGKKDSFIPLRFFLDRNFTVSTLLMFCVGVILFSSITLSPLFLQNLIGYPVFDAGLLTAPRGVGTLFSMFIVGKLIGKIDSRILVGFGLLMAGVSSYMMSFFNLDVTEFLISVSGLIQGFGLGFVFVPLSATAFLTLPDIDRPQASAIFSLVRTIGGAVGISLIIFLLGYWTRLNHAILSEQIIDGAKNVIAYRFYISDFDIAAQNQLLERQVSIQANLIGYLNSFKLTAILSFCAIPLVLLLKTPKNDGKIEITIH